MPEWDRVGRPVVRLSNPAQLWTSNFATHATAAQDLLQEYVQLAKMLLQATEYLPTLAKIDTKNQDQV